MRVSEGTRVSGDTRVSEDMRASEGVSVSEGMSALVLVVGPGHTLRQAARLMAARHVGAAVVLDGDGQGFGILTERDVLRAIAADQDPDVEVVGDHVTRDVVVAAPDWSLDEAAAAMLRGGFRHLVVTTGAEVEGVLSMRDVVRCWSRQRVSA
ncbi:putative signal-transduction protein with CBS domains [Parafrankia sp. EAN1pec]|nr:putative signal-transduction protein with CBS domains [Frankia sp. EAN1pec]